MMRKPSQSRGEVIRARVPGSTRLAWAPGLSVLEGVLSVMPEGRLLGCEYGFCTEWEGEVHDTLPRARTAKTPVRIRLQTSRRSNMKLFIRRESHSREPSTATAAIRVREAFEIFMGFRLIAFVFRVPGISFRALPRSFPGCR